MATEAELQQALQAGEHFASAITAVTYSAVSDEIAFTTPWGQCVVKRSDVDLLRDVPAEYMQRIYASQVGLHIDEIDLDINSAGLLAALFPDMRPYLGASS